MLNTHELNFGKWNLQHWITTFFTLCGPASSLAAVKQKPAATSTDVFSGPSRLGLRARRLQDASTKLSDDVSHSRGLKRAKIAPPRLEIVVAHYEENLRWLADYEPYTRVYHKSDERFDDPEEDIWLWRESLNNIGMESHTYLSHIVRRYHNLADVTLFTQAGIAATVDHFDGIGSMVEQALLPTADVITWRMPSVFRRWEGMVHTYKWLEDYNSGAMRHAGLSPAEFWHFAFGPEAPPVPKQVNYIHEATFAVHRHAIHRRPQEFYVRLLAYFEALNHTNPEEGHYMERMWLPIFAGTGRGIVYMPGGRDLPLYPADKEVSFPDDVTDGVWLPPEL